MFRLNDIIGLALVGLCACGLLLVDAHQNRPENPCPAEENLGAYGSLARFDGIVISGSPTFVSKTITALRRVYHTKSYRYISELDRIEERPARSDAMAWIYPGTRTAYVSDAAVKRGCTYYAATLVHEGAHVVLGSNHGPVYAAESRALAELGEPRAAQFTAKLSANSMVGGGYAKTLLPAPPL